jgi:argininosuccinate lyase
MELIRARTSTILACYNQILNILKGLPSGYNRDFQETKRPFIEGLRLTGACVRVMDITFTKLEVCEDRLVAAFKAAPDVFATDEALRLVVEGVPFRDAYRQVAASLDSLQTADPRASIAQRTHAGGPANLRLDLADEAIRRLRGFAEERRDGLRRVDDGLFGREETG